MFSQVQIEQTEAWLGDMLKSKDGEATRGYLRCAQWCVQRYLNAGRDEAERDHRDRIDNEAYYFGDTGDED